MATDVACLEAPKGGFSYDNCIRNVALEMAGLNLPEFRKTETIIAAVVYEDGVILGANTHASDKTCNKIHYLTPNIFCCGSGTAADVEMMMRMISSNLKLHRYNTGRTTRVVTANRMLKQYLYRYQGYVEAAFVLGGVDCNGLHLYNIHPYGSTDKLPYVTSGSEYLAAMATIESGYKLNMKKQEAMQLVRDAIAADSFKDRGSGSNVNLCVIEKNQKVAFIRSSDKANGNAVKQGDYSLKAGTTPVLSKSVKPIKCETVSETVQKIDNS